MRPILMFLLPLVVVAQTHSIAVIAHRGAHLHHPENTIPAYQAAIDMGADYIEVDVRTTADRRLVLMHDSTVDRTTTGHGIVKELTFARIEALDAGVKTGSQFAGTRVPTFDEALKLARGKINIYVDTKQAEAKDLVEAIERREMQNHVVIYSGFQFLQQVAALNPKMRVMPEAVNPDILHQMLAALPLRVIAFSDRDFDDATIAAAKKVGADIYVDRMGMADNPKFWQDAIDRGATGIQTNRPAELLDYLRSHHYHR